MPRSCTCCWKHPLPRNWRPLFLQAAEAAAPNATPREQATVHAARLFHDGKIPELIALCEETIRRYPRDMVMLKLGQYHTFNIGDFPAMLRIATRAFRGR